MYNYQELKPQIFTEANQPKFLEIRDAVNNLAKSTQYSTMGSFIQGISGDTWFSMACVDRLAELGEITEVIQAKDVAGQHRLFKIEE